MEVSRLQILSSFKKRRKLLRRSPDKSLIVIGSIMWRLAGRSGMISERAFSLKKLASMSTLMYLRPLFKLINLMI